MSFRTRIGILVAATAAVTVAIASLAVYFLVQGQMLDQVDATLRDRLGPVGTDTHFETLSGTQVGVGETTTGGPMGAGFGLRNPALSKPEGGAEAFSCSKVVPVGNTATNVPTVCRVDVVRVQGLMPPPLGAAGGYVQVVNAEGPLGLTPGEPLLLPVSTADKALARSGRSGIAFEDATVAGTHLRIATTAVADGNALQVAAPLTTVDNVLGRLRWILVGICAAMVLVAGALGRFVARRTLRPVDRLMLATEHVAGTRDLRRRIEEPGDDELGRLAHSFNRMLAALDQSERTQRQLVADASHELRTPLSSLRTNIEVLARNRSMDEAEHERLLADVLGQLERLSHLVADLIDLARGDEPISQVRADVAMDALMAQCADIARAHHPEVRFTVDAEAVTVEGDPDRISRAVANLLDNAATWSPRRGVVEVAVRHIGDGAEVTVRDHGPGIAPEHAAHVFQRFWRAPEAKAHPGSGLGLAIVQQVATTHGGDVVVESPPGGGALLRLRIPSGS